MNKQEVIQWICDKLTIILQFEVQKNMAEYILSMQSERQLDEYCNSLLDIKSPVHRKFLSELKKLYKSLNQKPASANGSNTDKNNKKKTKTQKKKIATTTDTKEIDKKQNKEVITTIEATDTDKIEKKVKSKQKKYVNIFSDEGQNCQEVFLKGRHKCNCEASKHGLINNCLKCGRIVCKQEGSGACVVCGELVCSNDELFILSYKNSESRKLHKKLSRLTINDTTNDKALEHRNTLLEFDRTSAKRTTVIDDQMDYYSANNGWLSSKQREQLKAKGEELHEKKHGSKKTKKITIDFAGRQAYEAEESDNDIDLIPDNEETLPTINNEHLNNPLIGINIKFDENALQKIERHNVDLINQHAQFNLGFNRVQDLELMLMTDLGLCLSMHQPYASLLLLNIKSHEGRTWFTPHRGRLWIASTAQKPNEEDIKRMETFYKHLKGENLEFPNRYPIGCLMGCVNVVDCLSQEEYITQYPQGEVESPFIFICKNPIMMTNHFPIKGQHKIFKLDEKIHYAAQKCLLKEMC
ncbi:Zinc finger, C2HC5-type,Zinc finger, RING/FYVE/PHD-type,ASCH domain,PUA-like domain [Cinara cedri]|uniref:Zinc finger, C2HC5-type,Zinc finger, RING/FYVE/PHD-type,ASCH domain,PUA-like domain n=1 Tax=Cinara cedri TaxID=506608 RepID=A0A5E4MV23_9HEMI|nr:Zinc finger, C2HC5-type,Zinc finger, RING/FYVE/PHD-type,ASCH domain,PUA-like domain [Cinara cedri]